jgi:hypothetical protein
MPLDAAAVAEGCGQPHPAPGGFLALVSARGDFEGAFTFHIRQIKKINIHIKNINITY